MTRRKVSRILLLPEDCNCIDFAGFCLPAILSILYEYYLCVLVSLSLFPSLIISRFRCKSLFFFWTKENGGNKRKKRVGLNECTEQKAAMKVGTPSDLL